MWLRWLQLLFIFALTFLRVDTMDAAIDLSDASKALDLANIRFQLMYYASPHARESIEADSE
jgi:hypothetical protein